MRLHRGMLRAGGVIDLIDDNLGLRKTLRDVSVSYAEEVTDIGASLWAHAKISGIIIRNMVLFVNKQCALSDGLHGVKDRWQFFVLDIDEVEHRACPLSRICGHGDDGITRVTH